MSHDFFHPTTGPTPSPTTNLPTLHEKDFSTSSWVDLQPRLGEVNPDHTGESPPFWTHWTKALLRDWPSVSANVSFLRGRWHYRMVTGIGYLFRLALVVIQCYWKGHTFLHTQHVNIFNRSHHFVQDIKLSINKFTWPSSRMPGNIWGTPGDAQLPTVKGITISLHFGVLTGASLQHRNSCTCVFGGGFACASRTSFCNSSLRPDAKGTVQAGQVLPACFDWSK